jgi:2-methylcitrate dehydratase PrpD
MGSRLEVRPETIPGAIADWVDGFSLDTVPTTIVEEARKAMINTAGTGLGGFHIEETQQAVSLAKAEEAGGPATIAVDGAKVSAQTAAFVNGLMFSALGQEDTHPESGSHPSETLLSALLAAAEVGEISGVRALEAQIIGLEVTAHVGSGSFLPEIKWERGVSASVFGAVGAAAALGKCFGLDRRRLQDAMVLAANLASGLMEGLMVSGTPEFHWSVARTPVNGYLAARLAQHGAYASPTSFCGKGGFYQVFLGVEPEAMDEPEIAAGLTRGLGSDWKLGEIIYKPWAVHFPILPYIDAARILRERHDLDPATVTEIAIEVDPGAASLGSMKLGPYENREEILGVAPFVVAGMLARPPRPARSRERRRARHHGPGGENDGARGGRRGGPGGDGDRGWPAVRLRPSRGRPRVRPRPRRDRVDLPSGDGLRRGPDPGRAGGRAAPSPRLARGGVLARGSRPLDGRPLEDRRTTPADPIPEE